MLSFTNLQNFIGVKSLLAKVAGLDPKQCLDAEFEERGGLFLPALDAIVIHAESTQLIVGPFFDTENIEFDLQFVRKSKRMTLIVRPVRIDEGPQYHQEFGLEELDASINLAKSLRF